MLPPDPLSPNSCAFVERNTNQWHLRRCSQSHEVVSCGVALGCSSYLRQSGARGPENQLGTYPSLPHHCVASAMRSVGMQGEGGTHEHDGL